MNDQSYLPQKKQEELKFPVNISLIILSISLFVIGLVIYSFQLCNEMNTKYSPLVDAAMEIQLEATNAHLLFEEILSGEKNSDISLVYMFLDNATWYTTAMLEGGKSPERVLTPLTNPRMREELQQVLSKIQLFREITKVRYIKVRESGLGSPIDQEYDAVFFSLLQQVNQVETELQRYIASDLESYSVLQVLLLMVLVFFTILLLVIFYRYEKQRIQNLKQLHESFEEVKVLNGMIPICASCKKIRDDDGYWNQIETYIKEHSEADFTHGYCPECTTELLSESDNDSEA